MGTTIEKLDEIENALIEMRSLLLGKSNLYCPGCGTLDNILGTINEILSNVASIKESFKLDNIISRLEKLEKTFEEES